MPLAGFEIPASVTVTTLLFKPGGNRDQQIKIYVVFNQKVLFYAHAGYLSIPFGFSKYLLCISVGEKTWNISWRQLTFSSQDILYVHFAAFSISTQMTPLYE